MRKDVLIAEIYRLLDMGEPLLTAFPKSHPGGWLQLPDGISDAMESYAHEVSARAEWGRARHQQRWALHYSLPQLQKLASTYEAGLLGWRAVGAIRE